MSGPIVVFRTHSEAEAAVVRALLESHGLHVTGAGSSNETRILVDAGDAEEARGIITAHQAAASQQPGPIGEHLRPLEDALGYRFRDIGLLEHALTHTSRAHEDVSGGVVDNESLEFLGDAVLGLVVADLLFRSFPALDEGGKSKAKSALVSTSALGERAARLSLGHYMLLGRGEEKTGGRRKQALLADTYEAIVAAMYLDGGFDAARAFITRDLGPALTALGQRGVTGDDFKSALQEYVQSRGRALPEYRLVATTGPDHRREFQVQVTVEPGVTIEGRGASKKEAEQDAARRALDEISRSR